MIHVGLVTLGCDKNTVDNEYLAGMLEDAGCEIHMEPDPEEREPLDAIVVTTCGFIGDAKEQSIETLVTWAEKKREDGSPKRLYVAGCLAQRYADDLLKEIPEIDGLVGVGQYGDLTSMVGGQANGAETRKNIHDTPSVDIYSFMRRRRAGNEPHSFLKISDGCNHGCTFCSIPLMKGRLKSVPHEILIEETTSLIEQGVKEINLVAQDLSAYGKDCYDAYRLPNLLRELAAIKGDFWLRCFYLYPGGLTDEMIETIAGVEKIVPYLDMPLQHLDPVVLRLMKRPHRDVDTVRLVERLRSAIPKLVLRTTMIVGFPGETPAAHQRMLDGMTELQFDWLGVFQYSKEEDTPAGKHPMQLRSKTKEARRQAVVELQAEITAARLEKRVGATERVLLEGFDGERRAWVGRTYGEAHEIDGVVYVESELPIEAGQFVNATITSSDTYDLTAALNSL